MKFKKIKKGISLIISTVFSLQVFAINKPCLAKDPNRTNKISILYTTDDGYFAPTIVSMESALQSISKDTFYDFHLMVNGEFSKTNDLERFKNKNEDKCSITTHNMGDDFKNDWAAGWPPSMYYRLKAASVLDKIDKCVYIDGDTLINNDLFELYNINLEDNYIGAVLESAPDTKINPEIYINSGILLMNLKKIRTDNKETKLLTEIEKNTANHYYEFPDQDILNVVFKDRIKLLPFKYNFVTHFFKIDINRYNNGKTFAERQTDINNNSDIKIEQNLIAGRKYSPLIIRKINKNYPTIIHFTHDKPWKAGCGVNNEGKNREVWEPLYQKWRETANYVEQKYGISFNKKSNLFSNPYVKWGTIVGGSMLLTTAIVGTGITIKKFYNKKIAKKPVSQLKKVNIA